jgi:hypothetical protein
MRSLQFLVVLLLIASPDLRGADSSEPSVERVIILVIDGPRWSETWGQPGQPNIPHRARELAPQAMTWSHYSNQGVTETTAGHTAMITGRYQAIDNRGQESPAYPSLLQHWIAEGGRPSTDAWIIASKDKLAVLADTSNPAWHGRGCPSTDCGKSGLGSGYRDDAETMQHVEDILGRYHPHLLLINLKEPDASGHAKDWLGYLKGIEDTDADAARLWSWLQHDDIYRNHTALFITNDHGRHLDGVKDGFVSHGCGCEGCRHIELMALGPGFARGTSDRPRDQRDLAATVAHLLRIDLPDGEGHPCEELWANADAGIAGAHP